MSDNELALRKLRAELSGERDKPGLGRSITRHHPIEILDQTLDQKKRTTWT